MKNFFIKYWKVMLISLLTVFWMNACTESCSKTTEINKHKLELQYKDSLLDKSKEYIQTLNDSIITLNNIIEIYKVKEDGLNKALNIQDEANKRIIEAKKNISITVKDTK